MLVIAGLLALLLRHLQSLILPLACVTLSVVWTFGLMALCGVSVSMLTIIVPVFLIAVGTAYCLHISSEYLQQIATTHSAGQATLATFRRLTFPGNPGRGHHANRAWLPVGQSHYSHPRVCHFRLFRHAQPACGHALIFSGHALSVACIVHAAHGGTNHRSLFRANSGRCGHPESQTPQTLPVDHRPGCSHLRCRHAAACAWKPTRWPISRAVPMCAGISTTSTRTCPAAFP